jgi:hypothetical protein
LRLTNLSAMQGAKWLLRLHHKRIPAGSTIKTCKDTLFAFRSTPSGPKPGGVFHLGLRTWPPAARPDLGVPSPFFLSLSLLPADAQTAKSARTSPSKSTTYALS